MRAFAVALVMMTAGVARAGAPRAGAPRAELPPLLRIEDPADAMKRFRQALAKVKAGKPGALLRVVNYGDSFTSDDAITRRARERLQELHGDGGAGWVPFALPSPSFRHMTVKRTHSGWKVKNVTFKRIPDGRYGIGGSAFEGTSGAQSTFMTMAKGTLGTKVSRYELQYLVQPGGGTLELTLDGQPHGTVDTAGPEVSSGFHAFEVADGAHTLKVRVTRGRVRVFGVVMERPGPGVTYDNLGLASNSARALRGMNAEQLRQQHAHRDVDLVVVHLGGNGIDWFAPTAKSMERYQEVNLEFFQMVRAAAPQASCLVMAPTDSGFWARGVVTTKPGIPGAVEAQRRAAHQAGCAFWDTFAWRGGTGALRKGLTEGNWTTGLNHPNSAGAERIGLGLVEALEANFAEAKAK